MSADLHTPLLPGDRLDRYELLCPIASGGMASVWVARFQGKHGFEKLVAIKMILPQFASDVRFRNMFLDEARILSRIEHANVAQVLDMGEERDLLYLAMEFVDGDSASRLLEAVERERLHVPVGILLRILSDTCLGLHAAHELRDKESGTLIGLVHRDVSPQNVLITQAGATKLIDFGIAKAKGRLAQDTNAGGIKGKIAYMAPEQAAGKAIDRRADVWAIGAILYGAYAQRTPYEAETELDTLQALVAGKDPVPLGPEAPDRIRDIVAKATSFSPDVRHGSSLELSCALESALTELGLPTSQADVAAFMGTHLRDRAAARRRTLELARQAVGGTGAREGLDRLSLDSPLPPPPAAKDGPHPGGTRGYKDGPHPGGTRGYEEPGFDTAPTAYKSANPPPVLALNTVPDLDVPVLPPKPPPPLPKSAPKKSAAPEPVFTPPPPLIASAAGSIIGPDVIGPAANRLAEAHRGSARDEFLDPIAIAAKRAGASSVPPPHIRLTSDAPRHETHDVLSAAHPTRAIVVDTQAELRKARTQPKPRAKLGWALAATATAIALAGIGVVTAPGWAKRRAVAAAEEQGLALGIDRATVGWSTVHFYGVTLSSLEVPSVKMTAPEATLDLRLLDCETITVHDPSVTLEGSAEEVERALSKLRARASAGTGKAKGLIFQNGRVTWDGPLGEGSRIDAESVGLDLTRGASSLGDEARLTSPTTRLLTRRGLLGPWRVDGEHHPKASRLRIGFDPVLADGPSAIFVRTGNGTTATVKIARQPLTRLGIPHGFFGLAPDEQTHVEAQMQLTRPMPARIVGDASITVYDARMNPEAPRLDLVLKGQFAGEPGGPLEINRTQLSFGPLTARVLGAVTLFDESFRVDLQWAVPAMPCGVLLKKLSPREASASGVAGFDSRRPDQAEFKVTQAATCGLSIFPSP